MRRAREPSAGTPAPPAGLRAGFLQVDGETLLVLGHDLPQPGGGARAGALLTAAERLVVELALEGRTLRQIAARRGTSVSTASKQLQAAYRKLGVTSRRELCARLGSR